MADDLLSIYERCKAIGMPADLLREGFWREFAKLEHHACSLFSHNMSTATLVDAMDQLQHYYDRFIKQLYEGDKGVTVLEKGKVTTAMERLIESQLGIICEKESTWDATQCSMMVTTELIKRHTSYHNLHQWYNQKTGECYDILHTNDIPDSPFHWQKEGDTWKNKITKRGFKARRIQGCKK